MAKSTSSEVARDLQEGGRSKLILNPNVRCPCCDAIVADIPPVWRIEPCRHCKRPLMLVRMATRTGLYHLRNVIDLAGSIYGIVTMLLVISFVASGMGLFTFAKAITILLFVIGSILAVDGVLSLETAIDQSWKITRRGTMARVLGFGKIVGGLLALALVAVGLSL